MVLICESDGKKPLKTSENRIVAQQMQGVCCRRFYGIIGRNISPGEISAI
jgi:hypothetical protein